MKKRRRKRKRRPMRREKFMVAALAAVLLFLALIIGISACHSRENSRGQEVRAVWLAYVDFKALGMYNQDKAGFRESAEKFFEAAKKNSINTVYFHVRAFRDAAYKSKNFEMSRYIWGRDEEIPYDPLKIMTKLAHKNNMELHAWLNPYRNYELDQKILDPAAESSTAEILLSVREILDGYDVDGIHFDDYFYKEDSEVPESEKKEHVNRMVKAVYSEIKATDQDLQFGISPAGNIDYCQSIGADVKTWMSETGYVDYIVPQIYWTDQHSASWREKMFTETLDEWISLNQRDIPLYVGLAFYRAGKKADDDPGWKKNDNNLARQLEQLRKKNCDGYAIFSAKDLFRKGAAKELKNFQEQVEKQ